MLCGMLKAGGSDIVQQAHIGRYCVDALLPASRTVVEYDGDYWHGLPGKKERDDLKDRELLGLGFTVIRIKEREFISDPNGVLELIKNATAQRAEDN